MSRWAGDHSVCYRLAHILYEPLKAPVLTTLFLCEHPLPPVITPCLLLTPRLLLWAIIAAVAEREEEVKFWWPVKAPRLQPPAGHSAKCWKFDQFNILWCSLLRDILYTCVLSDNLCSVLRITLKSVFHEKLQGGMLIVSRISFYSSGFIWAVHWWASTEMTE